MDWIVGGGKTWPGFRLRVNGDGGYQLRRVVKSRMDPNGNGMDSKGKYNGGGRGEIMSGVDLQNEWTEGVQGGGIRNGFRADWTGGGEGNPAWN